MVDRSRLAEIFMLGPARSPGHAVFRDLAELPPACYLTYDHGALQVHRYWKLHAAPHTDSPADTIERTHQLVTDAVERQLVSDVPVCTFLSGGLDSSIISEIAARKMAAQGSGCAPTRWIMRTTTATSKRVCSSPMRTAIILA